MKNQPNQPSQKPQPSPAPRTPVDREDDSYRDPGYEEHDLPMPAQQQLAENNVKDGKFLNPLA